MYTIDKKRNEKEGVNMKILSRLLQGMEQKQKEKQSLQRKKTKQAELLTLIQAAQQEIAIAQKGFESVSNGDMTDYFIHQRIAAEIRYTYLLKQYKNEGFCADLLPSSCVNYPGHTANG